MNLNMYFEYCKIVIFLFDIIFARLSFQIYSHDFIFVIINFIHYNSYIKKLLAKNLFWCFYGLTKIKSSQTKSVLQ